MNRLYYRKRRFLNEMAYMPRTYAGLIKKYFYYRDAEYAEEVLVPLFIDYFWDNHDVLVNIVNAAINTYPAIYKKLYNYDSDDYMYMARKLFNDENPLVPKSDTDFWNELIEDGNDIKRFENYQLKMAHYCIKRHFDCYSSDGGGLFAANEIWDSIFDPQNPVCTVQELQSFI